MTTAFDQFKDYLAKIGTEPELMFTLVGQLEKWFLLPSTRVYNQSPLTGAYLTADKAQKTIGWHRFVQ